MRAKLEKKHLLAVLVALAAPALWLGSGGSLGPAGPNLGLGQKLAGGWLLVADLGYPVEVMCNYAADGGVMMNGTLRDAGPDGTGGWMGTRWNTTSHGSWTRAGSGAFHTATLLFIQDNDGNTVLYEKVMMDLTLTGDGTQVQGTGLIQLIKAGNDPLDPEVPVMVTIPVPAIAGRLIR